MRLLARISGPTGSMARSKSRDANRRRAVDLARQALRVGGDDPGVLTHAGHVLGYFGEEIKAAIGLMDRSLELNPSFAHGWRAVAVCCSRASRVSLISRAFSIA